MVVVQFTDESETEIQAVFGCPQDDAIHQSLGEVATDDERYLEFLARFPSPPA